MNKKIQQILKDLYMIDPEFKKEEGKIVKIIEELLRVNPDIKVDESFMQKLRNELSFQAEKMSFGEPRGSRFGNKSVFQRRFAYSFAALVLFLALFSTYFFYKYGNIISPVTYRAEEQNITKLASNAFGSLSQDQSGAAQGRFQGGGGGVGGGGGIASERAGSEGSIAPLPLSYRFVYRGEDFTIDDSKNTVYKRVSDELLGEKFSNLARNIDLDLVDLNEFRNLKVSYVTISEDRDFGYEISFSSREGIIYINQNWMKWPDPYSTCRDQFCYENLRLKISDVPSDEELISIANDFIGKYKIGGSRSSYGDPVIFNSYEYQLLSAKNQTDIYIPEYISVIYPMKIDGNSVYELGGNFDGIIVDVSIRNKKVSSARNIYVEKYESSSYEIETDANRIIKFAESNGFGYGVQPYGESEVVEIELGTPSFGLVKTWKYNQEKRISEEIYVPSYIFPVNKIPEGKFYYARNVTVPIVKDMMQDSGVIYPVIPEASESSEKTAE